MVDDKPGSKILVAPMMDWTDRHCRYFMRLLNRDVWLYTEMITAAALCHGDAKQLLRFDESEHPVALQIGGSDPALMVAAAKIGANAGYDEININVGCPSDRVQSGQFGACLMNRPETVAECVQVMRRAVSVPVTIKSRIGVDDHDDYEFLRRFIQISSDAGCEKFVVHARKAILDGLSPKENRSIPPLVYERVYQLKQEFPQLVIVVNGGINSIAECHEHLRFVDGVMIGRQAYQRPWFLAELEAEFANGESDKRREDVVRQMIPYISSELECGAQLKHITRHMLGLFAGQPGARAWRRFLSEQAHRPGAGIDVLEAALEKLPKAA